MKVIISVIVFIVILFSCKVKQNIVETVTAPCAENTTESCVCIELYDPVCGCNNKTYTNSCHAECSGVTYVKGKCKGEK